MGLLRDHEILEWEEILDIKEKVKFVGILQFIRKYKRYKDGTWDLYWGDEVEAMLCVEKNKYALLLCSKVAVEKHKHPGMICSMEYAGYMLETTPDKPFSMCPESLAGLEQRLEERRKSLLALLSSFAQDSFPLFLTCFPNLKNCYAAPVAEAEGKHSTPDRKGHGATHISESALTYDITHSKTFPDNAIAKHNRFLSFTKNIVRRRGRGIEGYVKIMEDVCTKDPGNCVRNAILVDSMGQGMGCCCLQITMQYSTLDQARTLYDFLAILAPLMLRISRATPVANGYLLSTETRWDIISFSVDCRTDAERGKEYDVVGGDADLRCLRGAPIAKSRFSSIDMFISRTEEHLSAYNNIPIPNVPSFTKQLTEAGVDKAMAMHVSSLFIRDPILAYEKTKRDVSENPEDTVDEFENIQSSNWRSVRLKVPQSTDQRLNGWKVEFRTLEVQPTSFENAALTIFVVLLSSAIIHYGINLYIQMSLVEKNFENARRLGRKADDFLQRLCPDSIQFYYRSNIFDKGLPVVEKGTIGEIFCGKGCYPGLLSLARKYVDDVLGFKDLEVYLDFVSKKARGEYMSVSEYIRRFVISHEKYSRDSVVGPDIVADLISRIKHIQEQNTPSYLENADL